MFRRVLDRIVASVVFLVGTCGLAIKRFRARQWPVRDARVMSTEYENGAIGWHVVTVYYEYRIDGKPWGTWQTRPFVAESAAKAYANALQANTPLKARVKPSDPAVAVLIQDPVD